MNIKDYLEQKRVDVDRFLDSVMPSAATPPTTLHESMRYSLMAGGKRVRPILAIAAAEAVGQPAPGLMPIACSLELIHTYSLIHDDLPAMDNDDFRRGKPTNHKVYGDAMAILAGDALLTMAFDLCSRPDLMKGCDPARQVRLIQELAYGSGNMGMVGGQVFDIQAENKDIDLPTLQNIHKHKTGMLIRAAVRMGAIAAGANDRPTGRPHELCRGCRTGLSDRGRCAQRDGNARGTGQEPQYRRGAREENLPDVLRSRGSQKVGRRLCGPRDRAPLPVRSRPPTRSANWPATSRRGRTDVRRET